MNYITTLYTEHGSKIRVALCATHRHNRIFAGDVYGARTLKSDGNHTTRPCHDCPQMEKSADILSARRALNGNTHLARADKTLVCGTVARTAGINYRSSLENVVTCSRCRSQAGWQTIAGSYQQRSTSGLDSSAWGANKGR